MKLLEMRLSSFWILPVLAGVSIAAPVAAQPPQSAGDCLVSEAIGAVPEMLVHLPIRDSRIVEVVQRYAEPSYELLGYVGDLGDKLAAVDEAAARGGLEKFSLGSFATVPFQSCYESRLDRIATFVKAINTTVPDTAGLYPTVGDWLAGDPPCKAHRALKDGIDKASDWLDQIDQKITLLSGLQSRLGTLSNALYTAGRALFEGGERLMGIGLGKVAGVADAMALQGLYLSEDLRGRANDVQGDARLKALAAETTKRRLSEELLNLREAETTTREKFGAQGCGLASTGNPSESAADKLRRLREKQAEKTAGQWQDVNSSMQGQGDRLRRQTADAAAGYRQDADRIEAEMLAYARDSMSKTLQDISRRNAGRYGGGTAANCDQSRRKVAALDEWLVEARRSRASMGGRQHDSVIARVAQERNAEMAAARRMGCSK